MNIEKKFPVNILDNLYIVGMTDSTDDERAEFLKLYETEMMDKLFIKYPEIRKRKEKEEFSPSFGNYLVSNSPEFLICSSSNFAKRKAEELFAALEKVYPNMRHFYYNVTRDLNTNYSL